MTEQRTKTLAQHVSEFQAIRPRYESLAEVMRDLLTGTLTVEYPHVFVSARVKSVGGFAEKVVRKQYQDPLDRMTDLCGVRIVVQTTTDVAAVVRFIEANFAVHEIEDKRLKLDSKEFGYSDLHLVVSIADPPHGDVWAQQALAPWDVRGLRFEVQVRTWLQHAWAELVHDRVYKVEAKPSAREHRRVAALAALLEEGDRLATEVAGTIDARNARYVQRESRQRVEEEIRVRTIGLGHGDGEPSHGPDTVALARMQRAVDDLDGAIRTLQEATVRSPARDAELGHCLCLRHWEAPTSPGFGRGVELLTGSLADTGPGANDHVERARRQSRLGWALARRGELRRGAELLQAALDSDWENPYILSDALTLEHAAAPRGATLDSFTRREVARGVSTCVEHAAAGLELPRAHFTAARLSLLLGERLAALSHYARGFTLLADPTSCRSGRTRQWENDWIESMAHWPGLDADLAWVKALLEPASEADRYTPVVISGRVPDELASRSDLTVLPDLPESSPSAESVKQAIVTLRRLAGGGPNVVLIDGAGGHPIYTRVALALGATVAIAGQPDAGSVLRDPAWPAAFPMLMAVPDDASTLRELASDPLATSGEPPSPGSAPARAVDLEPMARTVHEQYLQGRLSDGKAGSRAPLCVWDSLPETYRRANEAQAAGIVRILRESGFDVVATGTAEPTTFTTDEIEHMAEREHGRWNVERLRDGWRFGDRDDQAKLHNNLVSWSLLPEDVKQYDREAVAGFAAVLAEVGLVVVRRA